jgi:hypothetical protein
MPANDHVCHPRRIDRRTERIQQEIVELKEAVLRHEAYRAHSIRLPIFGLDKVRWHRQDSGEQGRRQLARNPAPNVSVDGFWARPPAGVIAVKIVECSSAFTIGSPAARYPCKRL